MTDGIELLAAEMIFVVVICVLCHVYFIHGK